MMEQRLYGVNTATLHHYPQHLGAAYPALHQGFPAHRQGAFSSMYASQAFSGGLAYAGQGQDWTFTNAAAAAAAAAATSNRSHLGNVNPALHGGSACSVFGSRDGADFLYTQGGSTAGSGGYGTSLTSHQRGIVSGGTHGYCDVVYPGSYSPHDHGHVYPPSPSQSLSSSPSSIDSSDKVAGAGECVACQFTMVI